MEILHTVKEIENFRQKADQYHNLICHYLDTQIQIIKQLCILDDAMNNLDTDDDTVSTDNLQFKLDDVTVKPEDMIFTQLDDDEPIDVPDLVPKTMYEPKKKRKKSSPIKIPVKGVEFDITLKPKSLSNSIKVSSCDDNDVKVISTQKAVKSKRGRPKK